MKIITHEQIQALDIPPSEWLAWAGHVLDHKSEYIMPPKTSLHFGTSFFNTMPSILPGEGVMGVKMVNRYVGRTPSLESQLLLYDYATGEVMALMDADIITTMRTAAVAIHAMRLFANPDFDTVSIMGVGSIGTACVEILLDAYRDRPFTLRLLRYKDHAERTIERFQRQAGFVRFVPVDSTEELICGSDVVLSSVTYADSQIGKDAWFKEGCLVLPVHLRGFENCDLFFDKVYGDDRAQIEGFRYFQRFRFFAETSEVLRGERPGREHHSERILSYNAGLSLHDIYAAKRIYEMIQ